jgi:hypothetical protein
MKIRPFFVFVSPTQTATLLPPLAAARARRLRQFNQRHEENFTDTIRVDMFFSCAFVVAFFTRERKPIRDRVSETQQRFIGRY